MRLFIVVGYETKGASPELVYLGRDGSAAIKARESAHHAVFEIFNNPLGIRKNNPRPGTVDVAAQLAALDQQDREAVEQYEKDLLDAFQRGEAKANLAYTECLAAADAKIKELTDALLKAEKQSIAFQAEAAELKTQLSGQPAAVDNTAPLALEGEPAATPPEVASPPAAEPPKPTGGKKK